MSRRMAALVLFWWATAAPGPSPSRLPDAAARAVESISTDDLRQYVGTLASDQFNGRGVGDRGNRAAEEFICATLMRNGVTPAGADGSCYQAVEVYRPVLGPSAHLTVASDEGKSLADLTAGTDFYPLPETGDAAVAAPLVLAGHGVSAPQLKYDDYARTDVRGAIVLVREGFPPGLAKPERLTEAERDDLASLSRKLADAKAHGARGVLVIGTYLPEYRSIWPERASVRQAAYRLVASLRASAAAAARTAAVPDALSSAPL